MQASSVCRLAGASGSDKKNNLFIYNYYSILYEATHYVQSWILNTVEKILAGWSTLVGARYHPSTHNMALHDAIR